MLTRTLFRPSRALALTLTLAALTAALVTATDQQVVEAAPGDACQAETTLVNGSFESPAIAGSSYQILPTSSVPGWATTDDAIEIWSSGFNGVPAQAGAQFAEINANVAGTLYQDVATTPGQTLRWSLLHRARVGTDVMDVVIGAPSGALNSQGAISDDTSAWGAHSGLYVVPAGQTVTRFGFRAVSTGSGSASIGNFLDDVTFGNGSCLVTSTTMTNLTSPGTQPRVGDVLEYTVAVENRGGSPAIASSVSSAVPAGVSVVPGTIRVGSAASGAAPSGTPQTDAAADDAAEAIGQTVTARLGSGATAASGGSIAPGTVSAVVFRAVVQPGAAMTTVAVTPVVTSTDSLSGSVEVVSAPTVSSWVPAAADVSVSLSVSDSAPVAGVAGAIVWSGTVSNTGPQQATGSVLHLTIPAALTAPQLTVGGVACAIAAGVADCAIGTLPSGAGVSIELTGTLASSVPTGTALDVTATVSAVEYDPTAANDSATASAVATALADLELTVTTPRMIAQTGDDVEFAVSVANSGPSDVTDATAALTFPVGATATPSAGTFDPLSGIWTIGTLAVGQSATLTFGYSADDVEDLDVTGSVTSTTVDPDAGNNASDARVSIAAPVLVVVTPVSPAAPAAPGSTGSGTTPTATPADLAAAAVASEALAADRATVAARLAYTGAAGADQAVVIAIVLLGSGLLLVIRRRRRSLR